MEFWFHLAFLQPVTTSSALILTPINSLLSFITLAFRAFVCAVAFLSLQKVNAMPVTASRVYKPLPNPGG